MRSITSLVLLSVLCAPALRASAVDPPAFDVAISSSIVTLPFRAIDAEFSTAKNAIIAVGTTPNQLHIYDPEANTTTSVNLQVVPICVSVSPDGQFALVGHDAWISYVDLSTATLLKTIAIPATVRDVVLGGNGYAYVFTTSYTMYSVRLDTEAQTTFYVSSRNPSSSRLHPSGTKIYGADRNVSPADIVRFNIEAGPPSSTYDSPYHGDYSMCGDVWISMDGLRLFTACGNVFRASDDYSQDMRYAGKLTQESVIEWAAHSQPGNNVAVLPRASEDDDEIHYYTHDFLLYRGKAILPQFTAGDTNADARGRWLFFNAAGTKQYVVVQADASAGLTNDYGVVTVDCTNATISFNPTSQSVAQAGGTVEVPVIGTAGCGWKAISNAAWINTLSSGVGDGTVTFTATANTAITPRTGTISIGSATLTVTQTGLNPGSVVATATSPTTISLTWSASGAVDHFEVWRTSGGAFTLVGTPAAATFTDSVSPDAAYVYKVRSMTATSDASDYSVPDYAHTFTLTDPALTPGILIKAAHVTELRSVVNAIRSAAGLGAATFTDASLSGVAAKLVHVTELRDSLAAIRTALGMPSLSFTPLPAQSVIRAADSEELRTGAR
jgi:hypothetical protein